MKVGIKNYEILNDVELEFKKGLNIIVGETNHGKSSIFRAIYSAIFNEIGNGFINSRAEEAEVVIEDEDDKVKWNKRKNKSPTTLYKVNGEDMKKVGRTQVEEVAEALNIEEVELTSDVKERINFWQQMKYPFLLDKTSSQLFEFLSLSSENDNLTEVVKDMKSDLKDIKKRVREKENSIDTYKSIIRKEEKYLNSKKGFGDLYDNILSLEPKINSYKDIKNRCKNIMEKQNKRYRLDKVIDKLSDTVDETTPELNDLENVINYYVDISKQVNKIKDLQKKNSEYKQEIKKYRNILDSVDLKTLKNGIRDVIDMLNDYNMVKNFIFGIEKLKEKKRDIEEQIKVIENILGKIDLNEIESSINDVCMLIDRYNNIKNDIINIENLLDKKRDMENRMDGVEGDIHQVIEELEEFDICPFCNSEL